MASGTLSATDVSAASVGVGVGTGVGVAEMGTAGSGTTGDALTCDTTLRGRAGGFGISRKKFDGKTPAVDSVSGVAPRIIHQPLGSLTSMTTALPAANETSPASCAW
jgi:hypothetical protein